MPPFRVDDLLFAISATLLGSVALITRGGAEPLIDPHAAFLASQVSAPLVTTPQIQGERVETALQPTAPAVQAAGPADVRQDAVSPPSASDTIPQAPRPRQHEREDDEDHERDDD